MLLNNEKQAESHSRGNGTLVLITPLIASSASLVEAQQAMDFGRCPNILACTVHDSARPPTYLRTDTKKQPSNLCVNAIKETGNNLELIS